MKYIILIVAMLALTAYSVPNIKKCKCQPVNAVNPMAGRNPTNNLCEPNFIDNCEKVHWHNHRKCVFCDFGYHLTQNTKNCLPLTEAEKIVNCKKVNHLKVCKLCDTGYGLVAGACVELTDNCIKSPNGSTTCIRCAHEFKLTNGGLCVPLVPTTNNCVAYKTNNVNQAKNPKCKKCEPDYYLNSSKNCVLRIYTDVNCEVFKIGQDKCATCKVGYYSNSGICTTNTIPGCQIEEDNNGSQECKACETSYVVSDACSSTPVPVVSQIENCQGYGTSSCYKCDYEHGTNKQTQQCVECYDQNYDQYIYHEDCAGDETQVQINDYDCITKENSQACYNHIGTLSAVGGDPEDEMIVSDCSPSTKDGDASLEVTITYEDWKIEMVDTINDAFKPDCHYERFTHYNKDCDYSDPSCTGSGDDTDIWGPILDSGVQVWNDDDQVATWHLKIEDDVISDTSKYCSKVTENATEYVFMCFFAEDVKMYGVTQYVLSFSVTVTIERGTTATKSLQVTKTLVQGQCCKNSLGVESQLWFCENDSKNCAEPTGVFEIPRNTEFIAKWSLDTSHPDTATLAPLSTLYPDTVTIGPFVPNWSIPTDWNGLLAADTGISLISLQSNVAFAASITVVGKIYLANDVPTGGVRPHTCFPVDGDYPVAATCTTVTRRILQETDKFGKPESQTTVSKPIVFNEPKENQTKDNKSNKSDDDNNNTVIIAVVVALAVVVVIGVVIGIVVYKRGQKGKQSEYDQAKNDIVKEQKA